MRVRRHLYVSGRVQGVFYRDTCRRVAQRAGVAGWAENLDDGRVEIVLEGDPDAVEGVIAWCRKGTAHAEVSNVEMHEEPPEDLREFAIR